jgi:four helix bundle protein
MRDYQDLEIWKRSYKLGLEIYKITNKFPKTEIYALTDQLRRAILSVSTNIAEGCGRSSSKEYIHFMQIALGSLYETENLLMFGHDLNYVSNEVFEIYWDEIKNIKRMLTTYIKKIKKNNYNLKTSI